jgi:ectoine hydroxylase-related dioxygenase (phytanoyl-CoA dioxygenase family)
MSEVLRDLPGLGYALTAPVLRPEELEVARAEADQVVAEVSSRGGARSVLRRSSYFTQLAEGVLADLAGRALQAAATPVKATLFDKTSAANWKVPWHQDLTISVRERRHAPGFGPWSIKDGVVHVQPPPTVLESMIALRLHLDDTPSSNGALRVLPGSHLFGRLEDEALSALVATRSAIVCAANAGQVLLMRPLILHASSRSETPRHRRVLHVEYASERLPHGLEWAA